MGDPSFWAKFCVMMLHEIILEEYSSDMGHGWKNRCEVAHTNLVQKYEKVKLREFLWPIPHVTMEEAGELHGFLGLVNGAVAQM